MLISDLLDLFAAISCGEEEEEEAEVEAEAAERDQLQNNQISAGVIQRAEGHFCQHMTSGGRLGPTPERPPVSTQVCRRFPHQPLESSEVM